MRTSGGKAAPLLRWPGVLFRVVACAMPLACLPLGPALAASDGPLFDARTLLMLGISLGIIAFAVGTAIACLRATERARKAEADAHDEAERYRLSESTLDTLLAAEPQALHDRGRVGRGRAPDLDPAFGARRAARYRGAAQFHRLARCPLGRRARRCHRRPSGARRALQHHAAHHPRSLGRGRRPCRRPDHRDESARSGRAAARARRSCRQTSPARGASRFAAWAAR